MRIAKNQKGDSMKPLCFVIMPFNKKKDSKGRDIDFDYIYDSLEGSREYSYNEVRQKAMKLLSEIRKDIGIYSDEISYKGSR